MGLISPEKCKIGAVGGPATDVRRSYIPGPIGLMSRNGGMTTEIASLLTSHGLGQSTCISLGGDMLIGNGVVLREKAKIRVCNYQAGV